MVKQHIITNTMEVQVTEDESEIQVQTQLLINRVKTINGEIGKLQSKCSHREYKIEFVNTTDVRQLCIVCSKEIGYPTSQELTNFLRSVK